MIQFFNKKMSKKRKGFTLIELVVVIAILGILIAIAVPRLAAVRSGAALSADQASARAVASAVSIYEAQEGSTPTAIGDLVSDYLDAVPISETEEVPFEIEFVTGATGEGSLRVVADGKIFYPASLYVAD